MKNNRRPIDTMAKRHYSWWSKSFVFIRKAEIKTWQAIFLIAFFAGVCTTLVWAISINVHTISKAATNVWGTNSSGTDVWGNSEPTNTPSNTPSVTIISPNGGETFNVGDTITIRWDYNWPSLNNSVRAIDLGWLQDRDRDGNYETNLTFRTMAVQPGSSKVVSWTIPGYIYNMTSESARNKIKITASGAKAVILATDYTDAPFTINRPSFTVLTPVAGSDFSSSRTQIPFSFRWEGLSVSASSVPFVSLLDWNSNKIYGLDVPISSNSSIVYGVIPGPADLRIPVGSARYRFKVCPSYTNTTNCALGGFFTIVKR